MNGIYDYNILMIYQREEILRWKNLIDILKFGP